MSHVSRTLTELMKLNLIESLTPELRKSKMYRTTRLGREVLEKVKEF